MLANINGELLDGDSARISVMDRGFLYGDSVYEVIRTYEGRPFALDPHLDRLERSAGRIGIRLPERKWLDDQVRRTIRSAENPESYCRIMITRGCGPITLDPTADAEPNTVILVNEYQPFPDWMYQRGIRVMIPSIRRNPPTALDPAIKSGNYLNSVLALGEARRAGVEDALMLDVQGRISEASSANVLVYRSGKIRTPALETGILEGITRSFVLSIASDRGIPCEECDLYKEDLLSAEEVMLTSTLREVMPVVELDGKPVGTGKVGRVAKDLRKWYRSHAVESVRGSQN